MLNKGFELRIRCCVLKSFNTKSENKILSIFINSAMKLNVFLQKLHTSIGLKGYSFSGLIPYEKDDHLEGEIYDLYIRAMNRDIIDRFFDVFEGFFNEYLLVVDKEKKQREINNEIDKLYTTTPASINLSVNGESKQWTSDDGIETLKKAIANNLCKKYNYINGTNLSINANDIIEDIIVKSKYPISVFYKGGNTLRCMKFEVYFKRNSVAQEFAKIGYFLGLAEKNSSLGFGFTRPTFRRC